MAVISELIRTEENGKLSFGDYTLAAKAKDRKSTRLNSSHRSQSRMPSSA